MYSVIVQSSLIVSIQVNKPITKSPVLLPCYSNHMTKLHCKNWAAVAPFPARYHNMTSEPSFQSLSSASQSVQHGKTHSSLPQFYKVFIFRFNVKHFIPSFSKWQLWLSLFDAQGCGVTQCHNVFSSILKLNFYK